jgi:hypothetical protein
LSLRKPLHMRPVEQDGRAGNAPARAAILVVEDEYLLQEIFLEETLT